MGGGVLWFSTARSARGNVYSPAQECIVAAPATLKLHKETLTSATGTSEENFEAFRKNSYFEMMLLKRILYTHCITMSTMNVCYFDNGSFVNCVTRDVAFFQAKLYHHPPTGFSFRKSRFSKPERFFFVKNVFVRFVREKMSPPPLGGGRGFWCRASYTDHQKKIPSQKTTPLAAGEWRKGSPYIDFAGVAPFVNVAEIYFVTFWVQPIRPVQ